MKIVTAAAMRKIDGYCIDELKIPGIVLMENAALKLVANIQSSLWNTYIIVCGHGNNGGDGLAVARHLIIQGKKVEVFFIDNDKGTISKDCSTNLEILKKLNVSVFKLRNIADLEVLREYILNADVVIDAVFGTGLCRELEGIYNQIIAIMNENSKYIISIDIPSGMNSDTGEIHGNCVRANKTIGFQAYKRGFLNYSAQDFLGELTIEKIGIPEFVVDKFYDSEYIMDLNTISNTILPRKKYINKGNNGRLALVAGSRDFIGAAYILATSAVKSGAGLVTLCCRENIQETISSKLIEAMTVSFQSERFKNVIESSNAVAFGPGMGNNEETFEMLKFVLENARCPVLIDADGLNVLQNNTSILKSCRNKLILTPHLGEMARLTGLDVKYIEKNRMDIAKEFAKEFNLIVLLKGYNTIISDGNTIIINPTGNGAMATGGMGDCLSGIISALIAQGYDAFVAAYLGAYIHGYCGDMLSKEMFSINAESVINVIPRIIKDLENYKYKT